jgi:hypothetical protein
VSKWVFKITFNDLSPEMRAFARDDYTKFVTGIRNGTKDAMRKLQNDREMRYRLLRGIMKATKLGREQAEGLFTHFEVFDKLADQLLDIRIEESDFTIVFHIIYDEMYFTILDSLGKGTIIMNAMPMYKSLSTKKGIVKTLTKDAKETFKTENFKIEEYTVD